MVERGFVPPIKRLRASHAVQQLNAFEQVHLRGMNRARCFDKRRDGRVERRGVDVSKGSHVLAMINRQRLSESKGKAMIARSR